MNKVSCNLCGADFSAKTIPYPSNTAKGKFSLFKEIAFCSQCELGFALPLLNQERLDEIYKTGEYWDHVVKGNPYQNAHESNQAKIRVDFCSGIIPFRSGMRVLDIGAGHAYTADWISESLKGEMFSFAFIEHDDEKSKSIISKSKEYEAKRLDRPSDDDNGYDLIFMNHVLEHVANPLEFVNSALATLREGGALYIETPHADYRYKTDVFPHTLFFNKKTVDVLAERSSAELVCCRSYGRIISAQNRLSSFMVRVLNQFFKLAVRLNIKSAQRVIDQFIWQYYKVDTDNIWLQWAFRKK